MDYTATVDGTKVVFTADDAPTTAINAHYDVQVSTDVTGTDVAAKADIYTTGTIAWAKNGDETVTINYVDADGNAKSKDIMAV